MNPVTSEDPPSEQNNAPGQELLFQSNPLPMWVYDLETYRFLVVNDAAVEQYGYSREEFLSLRITDIRPEEDVPRLLDDLKQERPALQHSGGWRHRRKDGSVIDVEIHSHTLTYNGRRAALVTALNVTEKKRAEERLRYHASLLENVSDAVIATDARFVIQSWNKGAEALYGWTAKEAIGNSVAELIPTTYPNEPRQKVLEQFMKNGFWKGEVIQQHKDGTLLDIQSAVTLLKNDQGEMIGAVAINRDITNQKKAERFARETLNALTDSIAILDENGVIRAVNRAWRKFAHENGADPAQVSEGVNYLAVCEAAVGMGAEEAAAMAAGIRSVMRGERDEYQLEYPCHSPDEQRWFVARVTRFTLEGEMRVVVAHENITERRLAEDAIREREEHYHAIFNGVQDAILVETFDGKILAVNDRACEMFGYTREEFLTKTVSDLVPPGQPVLMTSKEQAADSFIETYNLRANGERFPVEISGRVQTLGGREILLVILRDVTERKKAEEAIRWQNAYLAALQKTTLELLSQLDLNTLLENIVERAGALIGTTSGTLELVDLQSGKLLPRVGKGALKDVFRYEVRRGEGATGTVWQTGKPLLVYDYDHWENRLDGFPKGLIASIAAVPLITNERVIGVLALAYEFASQKKFTYQDIEILTQFAHLASIAIENASLFSAALRELEEKTLAEKALAESEAKYRSLVDQIPAIVYLDDARTDLPSTRFVSPRIQELLGYSPEEWIAGDFDIWIESIHPEDRERVINHYLACMRDASLFAEEYRMFTRDGRIVWVRDSASVQTDEDGKPLRMQGIIQDITELKEAEAAMRLQSAALEAAGNAIVITDRSGAIQWINSAYTRLTGYTLEEAVGKTPRILYSGMQDEAFYKQLWDTILSGRVWHGELINKRKDGSLYNEEQTITPLLDSQGQVTHFIGIKQDITSRKRTEETLRASELRYRSLIEQLPAIVYIDRLDGNGETLFISPQIETFFGVSADEWMNADLSIWLDLIHPEDRERALQAYQRIKTHNEPYDLEYRVLRRDGRMLWIHDKAQVLSSPTGEPWMQGVMFDVTERKQAEELIRRQVEYLSALREIDQAITANFDMRVSLNFLLSRAIKLLSADAADVLLINPSNDLLHFEAGIGFRTHLPEKASVKLGESYAGIAAQERRLVQIPNLKYDPNNRFTYGFLKEEGFASYHGMPLVVKGRVLGVLEVFNRSPVRRDEEWLSLLAALAGQAAIAVENAQLFSDLQKELLERRLVEEKLRKSHLELEKRIEERTADIQRVNFELQRALRVKDEFLANMSHELRTPLNAVIGLSDSLAEQVAGPLNEKQQKYIATIRESGQHLLELINDILDLAKIEAGHVSLSREKVDVTAVCQSSLRMIKQIAQKKNLEVFFDMDTGLGAIWADERRLKQMLVNLLSNAVKFTPENGKIGLQVRGDREKNIIAFTVWDTGIGIREEDLPRLFQPFVQLDSNLARQAGGTGLGLALVAKMAAMHGGSAGVESEPGKGSRFTIRLPWESALVTGPLAEWKTGKLKPEQKHPENQRHTILLVEDTEEVILLMRDYLEYNGFKVAVAPNGVEGVAQAEAVQPSLILMDVQMPVMDGLEATRRIRKIPSLQRTPIIALTALAMKGDRERCIEAGMNDYISKPVELKALLQIIQNHLEKTEAAQA
ncbi:MAG: PAS domain S-box protein [Chloroflexota bacterium]